MMSGTSGRTSRRTARSRGVVSERFLPLVDTPVANLLRDDELFDAALVGIGTFGIVHAFLLEVEPLYSLVASLRRFDLDDVRTALGTLDVQGLALPGGNSLPFHFEIVFNVYRTRPGQRPRSSAASKAAQLWVALSAGISGSCSRGPMGRPSQEYRWF